MTLKTPDQIWDARTDLILAAIDADRARRAAKAWREGYQAGYENGYDGLYGRADNPYE